MKTKLAGVLQHRKLDRLYRIYIREELETGANYIVKVMHRFHTYVFREDVLANIVQQVDTCTWEDKNQYSFKTAEYLAAWSGFRNVPVPLFRIGHAYEDIDQAISQTLERLEKINADIMPDLYFELQAISTGSANVTHLKV